MAKVALEHVLPNLAPPMQGTPVTSAGRVGKRQGEVSELTVIAPLAKGGAKRLRGLMKFLNGRFDGADLVGTVHDMRFVLLDNDTKMLFTTAYDGEWDPYIGDFATKIPDLMDICFSNFEGWPGIHHAQETKDWIAKYQLTADAWYVANPNLTVVETRRLERIGNALEEFLDQIAG